MVDAAPRAAGASHPPLDRTDHPTEHIQGRVSRRTHYDGRVNWIGQHRYVSRIRDNVDTPEFGIDPVKR